MRTPLILCSAAVMAVLVPATLFAQTTPVERIAVAPVATYGVAKTIPNTVPDPKALATVRPVAAKTAVAESAVTTAKRPAAKHASAKVAVAKPATVKKAAAKAVVAKTAAKVQTASSGASDLDTAQSVLASLKGKYRYLDGVSVTVGKTPGGYQAVSYYTKGRIVISTSHKASIERIMKHEIWHIIDWRDNGKIDWRESVPPHNAADYLK